ncbi:MAG: ComF family protein [Moorellaceae bacterium]
MCGRSGVEKGVCPVCEEKLRVWQEEWVPCRLCGRLLRRANGADLCLQCGEEGPPFRLARAVGPYQGELRRAILEFKYRGRRSLARPLGYLLAGVVADEPLYGSPQVVIPVPIAGPRLRERAFNQSELLAREVGRILGIRVIDKVLIKVRHTPPQTGLHRRDRLLNLQGSLELGETSTVAGRDVLLVDDVLTTGATAAACTMALLQGGAKSVAVVTVATGAG